MKTKLFYALFIMTLFLIVACQFQNLGHLKVKESKNKANYSQIASLTPRYSTNLMAGNYVDVGNVNIYCDDENVFIEYETTDEWFIKNTHLYVGDLELIPINKSQIPNPLRFPIHSVCPKQTQSEIYMISKSNLPSNFAVAAHAEVKREVNGMETKTETAWCEGDRFSTDSWGMYVSVCKFQTANGDYVSL
jgi:hypothetical protein